MGLLVALIDLNPDFWGSVDFEGTVQQLLLFLNSHMALSGSNRVAAFGCIGETSRLLYPMSKPSAVVTSPNTGKLEKLAAMNDTIITQLNTLCGKAPDPTPRSALAVTLTKALCYVMTARARAARASEAADASRGGGERIVILSATASLHDQYIPMMNCIFAAQKEEIMVDACLLDGPSALLQQAAALTGGVYTEVKPRELQDLLHHLIAVFLPDGDDRELLRLSVSTLVDYRAACFCHGRAIDQYGFVCSECFSGETSLLILHSIASPFTGLSQRAQ